MKIVKPAEMTLLSCSISETDAVDGVVWSSSTTYSEGQKVRYNHVSYKSLENNNTNHRPDLNWIGENAYWQKLTATMPYRMLDDYQETQTIAPVGQDLTFSVSFTLANSFAFMNIHGGSLEIEITDSETTLYTQTIDLVDDITSLSLWECIRSPLNGGMRVSSPQGTAGEDHIFKMAKRLSEGVFQAQTVPRFSFVSSRIMSADVPLRPFTT